VHDPKPTVRTAAIWAIGQLKCADGETILRSALVDPSEDIRCASLEALADADLALLVMDASQPLSSEDCELLAQVESRNAIVVENKVDKVAQDTAQISEGGAEDRGACAPMGRRNRLASVRTSALTGQGIKQLRTEILRLAGGNAHMQHESGFLTNARHQGLVRNSLNALAGAVSAVEQQVPHEMLLLDLYNALRPLDEVTGATTADDILNVIFGSFCIGK
jgi:tRNA modification GTPase